MAARMAPRRCFRNAACLLAAAVKRHFDVKFACGYAPPRSSKLSRKKAAFATAKTAQRGFGNVEPAPRSDAVYDNAGSFSNVALSLRAAGGYCCRFADRQSQPQRNRSINRFLCQQFSAAYRFVGKSHFCGTFKPSQSSRIRSLRSPRFAV